MQDALSPILDQIGNGSPVPISRWPENVDITPQDLGFTVERGLITTPRVSLLQLPQLSEQLSWLAITRFHLTDSTNTAMIEAANATRVSDQLYVAECQIGGRGRRGRQWLSPYGRSLSMSLGFETRRKLIELGGLSSSIGVAIVEGLERLGVENLQLKWPNDVHVDDKKLCGILVELIQGAQSTECVVGVGINVDLTDAEIEAIQQPVTDLRRLGVDVDRTLATITLVTAMRRSLEQFESEGFASFVATFNRLHKFHERRCAILQGEHRIEGIVKSIGDEGELILLTEEGERRFFGGEVSLRGA